MPPNPVAAARELMTIYLDISFLGPFPHQLEATSLELRVAVVLSLFSGFRDDIFRSVTTAPGSSRGFRHGTKFDLQETKSKVPEHAYQLQYSSSFEIHHDRPEVSVRDDDAPVPTLAICTAQVWIDGSN